MKAGENTNNGMLHIKIGRGIEANIDSGPPVLPEIRKMQALLAVLALSGSMAISRHEAAAMLWSRHRQRSALARLRDGVYRLRKHLSEAGVDVLSIDDRQIALKADRVDVHLIGYNRTSSEEFSSDILSDLQGIDPAFDNWIVSTQERLRRKGEDRRELPTRADSSLAILRQRWNPIIAVPVFEYYEQNGGPDLAGMCSEEVAESINRIRWLKVLTRNKKGQRLSIGIEDLYLVADYGLFGVVQRDLKDLRVSIKLLDFRRGGNLIWAESFVIPDQNVAISQKKMANSVSARIESQLLINEAEILDEDGNGVNESGYSLLIRAIPAIYRLDRGPFLRSGHLLEQAINKNDGIAMAYAWLACWHVFLVGQGWAEYPSRSLQRAAEAANQSIVLDPLDARAYTIAGHVKSFLHRKLDEASALHDRALEINPAFPLGWHFSGMTHAYAGRLDQAHQRIETALELAPNDRHSFLFKGAMATIHLLRGEYQAALELSRRVTEIQPNFSSGYKTLLAVLGHLGQKSEALLVVQKLRFIEPNFSLRNYRATTPYHRSADVEKIMTGLRLAGIA